MQKEAVEMINIRVHDLKHQIQDMKNQGELTDKMIRQLEDSADIYQSVVQTGNDVLDVILSSVSLRCQKNKTQLTVMADGLAVSFMDDTDIYSLFGNMMDNAIEYENSIEEENLRFISLTIKKKEDIVYIHSENYFGKEMPKDDFLMTTKNDFSNHGYGTKSMKKIVEKYKGVIHFYVADQMFQVDCMIDTTKEVSS
jgi:sensor histidine kinase regulating citrate/malate metabolism